MTDDLIARLKAAHEAATPGPWKADWTRIGGPDTYVVLAERTVEVIARTNNYGRGWANANLMALVRNNLPEIIAALEAAKEVAATPCAPESRGLYCDAGHGRWPCAVQELHAALDALEKKG